MTIKIAFTGTGYISQIHARAAQKLDGVELVAVVNHRPESRRAFAERFAIPRQYETIEALLADGDVDAVSINTPNYLHAPETIAALEAGVHVMVEKPMAMDAAEARQMVAADERSEALLMVAHCWRFDEEALWLKEQLAESDIGAIVRSKGYGVHSNWGPSGWFTEKRYAGGGALADMGVHAIDTARFLLGDPRPASVYARIGTHYTDYDVDDTGLILVNWQPASGTIGEGATSYIESGWWQPHMDGPEAATQLYGTNGFASLYPTVVRVRQGERIQEIDPRFPHPRVEHCPQTMYDRQLAYFVEAIRSRRSPVPGGREGLVNMEIVDAAYESARSGEVVELE